MPRIRQKGHPMTVNHPKTETVPPLRLGEKLGIVIVVLLLTVGAFIGLRWAFNGAAESQTGDAYCDGWVNGIAWGISAALKEQGQSADPAGAAGVALSPDAPPCDKSMLDPAATVEAQWCAGFGLAYVVVGVDLGFGEPPQGRTLFVEEMVVECQRVGLPSQPVVPGRGVPLG